MLVADTDPQRLGQPVGALSFQRSLVPFFEKLLGGKKRGRAVRRITYEGRLVLRGSERYPENRR